jgi:hypothetical protein
MIMTNRRSVLVNRKPQQMELFAASQTAESLGKNDRLMEMILERNNIIRAWKRVCANKGVPGVDGMRTDQLGNTWKGTGRRLKKTC